MTSKKILAVVLVLGLCFCGCAAFNQFLCHPTDSQTEAANVGIAVAQSILTAAAMYSGGGAIISAVAGQAVPIFRKVVEGYCVLQAEWDSAVQTLEASQGQTKAMGTKYDLSMLKSVTWGK